MHPRLHMVERKSKPVHLFNVYISKDILHFTKPEAEVITSFKRTGKFNSNLKD